ncbi:hypothetical protein CkaCkLH20_10785 [Colletotrichum karsti]|uniref:2EXR domain-containing protein n=1 Tax=Colletotrichum karsti TaxID=1095194 RepID=A0A9P6I0N9_9PEZI|nr:uncharacterized protein CkaCkLH20_10785 [Colletotrichum karsti]KAF9871851.1 hypothetical protein CkaCkLH20_10785 [Colletotrichum karsti]
MPESSDESATEGVGLLQNDASDSESSVGSGSERGNGLLDLEASESGDSDSDSSDDASDSESDDDSTLGGGGRRGPKAVFTQFKKLPIELRHRIWELFCPDLHPSPRVLSFQMVCNPKQDVIWENTTLENQIHPVHAMLGVHQESRQIALKAFPDTLSIRQGRRTIYFNKERDIVQLNGHRKPWSHNAFVSGFSENVLHLAAEVPFFNAMEMQFLTTFPNLINFYKLEWHNEGRPPRRLRWCASENVHRYELQQLQKDFRVGEDLHFVYCWPDIVKHRTFAEKHASEMEEAAEALEEIEEIREDDEDLEDIIDDQVLDKLRGISYWRMTCFGWDAADRFPAFLAKYGDAPDDAPSEGDEDEKDGSSDEDDDSDQNEYESDGIDDATIDEESIDEDEDDLLVNNQQESEDEEDGGASDFGGFSPLRDEGGSMFVDGDASAAQFSSPEPETNGNIQRQCRGHAIIDSDEEEEEDEDRGAEEPARAIRRAPVVVSDDEEEEEEDKPSQRAGRPRRVVLSDDEDEDEEDETAKTARPAGRRYRMPPSDEEDEDEDEGGAEVITAEDEGANKPLSLAERLQRNRRQNPVSDEGESEEEESSEEEEQPPPKKMSLAAKLMAHRRKNPIESESEGDSEGTIGDDDDDLDDDEEHEDEESGMFMNMAEEGESDEEQDEDDY